MRNPYEDDFAWEHGGDESDIRDEMRFKCACGDEHCWGFNDDAANLKVNGAWYAADCEMGKRLDAVADGREFDSRADVVRDEILNGR